MTSFNGLMIAAIIPCHNESLAIAKVVSDLHRALPQMEIYVYDNCSTDGTAQSALAAGANVRQELQKGKGNVVRRAFADIDADVYLLIDGDDTYDAHAAPRLVAELLEGPFDHVLGVRTEPSEQQSPYRLGHQMGNRVLNAIVGWIFGSNENDMLSGYRVMSRRFVKSFPAVSREFEIETELTVHTLALRVPHSSVPVGFKDRMPGTESKLRTYRDGMRIFALILNLARHERPIAAFGASAAVLSAFAALLTIPVVGEYVSTGMVPRVPSLIVAIMLTIIAGLAMTAGAVLDGIKKGRHESARLKYLQFPPVDWQPSLSFSPLAESHLRRPYRPHRAVLNHGAEVSNESA